MTNTRLKARLIQLKTSVELDNLSGMELAAAKANIADTEAKIRHNEARRAQRKEVYKSLGLTRVVGACGGVYYE